MTLISALKNACVCVCVLLLMSLTRFGLGLFSIPPLPSVSRNRGFYEIEGEIGEGVANVEMVSPPWPHSSTV